MRAFHGERTGAVWIIHIGISLAKNLFPHEIEIRDWQLREA